MFCEFANCGAQAIMICSCSNRTKSCSVHLDEHFRGCGQSLVPVKTVLDQMANLTNELHCKNSAYRQKLSAIAGKLIEAIHSETLSMVQEFENDQLLIQGKVLRCENTGVDDEIKALPEILENESSLIEVTEILKKFIRAARKPVEIIDQKSTAKDPARFSVPMKKLNVDMNESKSESNLHRAASLEETKKPVISQYPVMRLLDIDKLPLKDKLLQASQLGIDFSYMQDIKALRVTKDELYIFLCKF